MTTINIIVYYKVLSGFNISNFMHNMKFILYCIVNQNNNMQLLCMTEPPERPLSVKVGEVWSRAATVSWSSPFDGNSPITQYIVHYWKDIEGKCKPLLSK